MSTDPNIPKQTTTVSGQKTIDKTTRSLIENNLLPAFLLNQKNVLVFSNLAFVECFERYWKITPTIGLKLNQLNTELDTTPINKILLKASETFESAKPSRYTHQIPFNGNSVELNASFTPINDLVCVTFIFTPIDIDKQTQDLHNVVLKSIAEAVICLDLMGVVTYWNQGATNVFGLTEKEMFGTNIRRIEPDFDEKKVLHTLNNNTLPYKNKWSYTRNDGSKITLAVSTDILYDAKNKEIGVIVVAKDITKNEKLERLIRYTHKAAMVGGWEIDLEKNLPLWTEETYNIHDVEIGAHVNLEEAFDFYHPESRPILQEAFNKLMDTGEGFDLEVKFISAKNVHKWVRAIGNSEVNSQGKTTVLGTLQDITKRKKAEEKEKASELLFRKTFDHASIGMALVDISGVLIDANPYMVKLLGFPKKELLKKAFPEFTHPDDVEKDLGLFQKTLSGEIDVYEMPKRYVTASGDLIWVQLNVSMYRNIEGEALMAIAMVQDITEKVQAEEQLKELNANLENIVTERTKELSESNEELETFSYMMSHDLRTPLRSAMLFSDILYRKHLQDLDSKGQDIFTHLRSSLTEMDQLVNDLLEYAKMRNKDLRKQKINTKELIDEVLTDVTKHFSKNNNHSFAIDKNLPELLGDLTLLYHVLRNIISNSFKYKKADQDLELTINAEQNNGCITLVIEDNGNGFSPKFAEEIFKPFERLVNRNDVQGSGLGLAIVQRVIEKHQGKVWAEGEEGVGAKFYIQLPCK